MSDNPRVEQEHLELFLAAAKELLREKGEVRLYLRDDGEIAYRLVQTDPPVTTDDL
ncbi:hypothetical protein [Salinibacter ruber]|uniref:hypothetical protein n=1 Tax=Salinibacter ruber TaxID=146919 RepID=UPI00216913E9|nr:hypothetical protein [Salinibacter ruber]MCS3610993.1 hypothetical protein [Salinibacter ruber]